MTYVAIRSRGLGSQSLTWEETKGQFYMVGDRSSKSMTVVTLMYSSAIHYTLLPKAYRIARLK